MRETETLHSPRTRDLSPGRVALFVVNGAALAGLLAWSLWIPRLSASNLPFASAFIFTVAFFLFLRPLVSAPPAWVLADSVVLFALNAAVLVLVGRTATTCTSVASIFAMSAVIGACAALAGRDGPFSRRSFLAAMFLLNILPVVAWLALAELVGARMDWLFAISPLALAACCVVPGVSPAVIRAGSIWMYILALLLVVWVAWHHYRAKACCPGKKLVLLLAVLGLSALAAGNAHAQDAEAAARLDLGVNGEIVAGAWNPARIMLSGISAPTRLSLVVDGSVTHDLLVEPDKWTEFLVFIPSEQPVVTLTGPGLAPTARAAVMPALKLRAVETRDWPGIVVTGTRSGDISRLGTLTERAPGVRFLEIEFPDLLTLPPSYLEQFPVVILETVKVEGPPRRDFVRLTEWMSSRTLAIPPDSRVRLDWPGLSSLHFEALYGYEVLNKSVLDLLPRPRVSSIDPDISFFGPAADWSSRSNRAVLAACLGVLLVGVGFYLVVGVRLRSPVFAAALATVVVAMIASAGWVKLSSFASSPVVSTIVIQESVAGADVALETRIRQISGAPGASYSVESDAPAGWVPVYISDSQSEANIVHVFPWKGEGPPDIAVTLAEGPQVFVSTRTRLISDAQPPVAPLLLRIVGGRWIADADNHADVHRLLDERSSSIRIDDFLAWFASRAPDHSRWSLRFTTEPAPGSAPPTIHVSALRLN